MYGSCLNDQIVPLSSNDRLLRWCHSERSSGCNPFTSPQEGNIPDEIHACSVMQVGSSRWRAKIRNESPAMAVGSDKSSSSWATQSSPEWMGIKSASYELPVESNDWLVIAGSETTGGQFGRVHCRHGDDGALESPSALPWSPPGWCMIENWNIIPSLSLNRGNQTNDLWSVWRVNLAPHR